MTKIHTVSKDQTHGGLSDGPTRCLLKEGLIASAAGRAVGLANSLQLSASSGFPQCQRGASPRSRPFQGQPISIE